MVELIVIIAIVGTLAVLVVPHISWIEPPKRVLQRAFIEAVDIARNGTSVRFRIDKEENIGAIIPEVLVRDAEKERDVGKNAEGTWKAFNMQWQPAGKLWVFEPEIIYFSQDGICTPAKITWGRSPYEEKYLLTVTGFLVDDKRF